MENLEKTETPRLTLGQQLVGISFNPSGDEKVNKAKQLCADLADLLLETMEEQKISHLQKVLIDNALCEILNAQMNVVKVLTFKL